MNRSDETSDFGSGGGDLDVPLWRVRLADLRGRGIYAGYPDRHRCIFIHIPKAAGTSVALSLFQSSSRHFTYTQYLRANPGKFRSYFKFAFVRNPWDRLVSTYFFLTNGGSNEVDREWSERYLFRFRDFRQFVAEGLARPEIHSWVHFRPQADFILSPENAVMVDFVGRYENLQADYEAVANRLGIAQCLVRHNAGTHPAFEQCYSPETALEVGRIYARDAEVFGYQPPM